MFWIEEILVYYIIFSGFLPPTTNREGKRPKKNYSLPIQQELNIIEYTLRIYKIQLIPSDPKACVQLKTLIIYIQPTPLIRF